MKIGCIGQGFVGKNTADNFEHRGYDVVRYALEPEYKNNAEKIADCEMVIIGVPTPTTPEGFDYSIVEDVLKLVADGAIAVIKSTLLPGTTRKLQDKYPNKIVLFSPEFLCEKTAAYDVAHPMMNVVGLSYDSAGHRKAAEAVMKTLPKSEHNFIVSAQAAELFKYAHNLNGYFRVILSNLLYEVAEKTEVNWGDVKTMMDNDIMMSPYYNAPMHKGGRGAGGSCFIKDMAAFRHLYVADVAEDKLGIAVLEALEKKNLELLGQTAKDQKLVCGVYGNEGSEKSSN
jgi:UDPglucose 6-dehydrogenase